MKWKFTANPPRSVAQASRPASSYRIFSVLSSVPLRLRGFIDTVLTTAIPGQAGRPALHHA